MTNLSTALFESSYSSDKELSLAAKEMIVARYGEDAYRIVRSIREKEGDTDSVSMKILSLPIPCTGQSELLAAAYSIARSKIGNPSPETLMRLYQSGNDKLMKKAKEQMILLNSRLIHKLVAEFSPSYEMKKRPEDLYQCGVLGVLRAMDGYDPDKGTAFFTYARNFIKSEVTAGMRHSNSMTAYSANIEKNINAAVNQLEEEGIDVTPDAISKVTGYSAEKIGHQRKYQMSSSAQSSDAMGECGTQIPDHNTCIEDELIEKLCVDGSRNALARQIRQLPKRQKKVLYLTYWKNWKREKIAKKLGVSETTIQNDMESSFRAMRNAQDLQLAFLGKIKYHEEETQFRSYLPSKADNDIEDGEYIAFKFA